MQEAASTICAFKSQPAANQGIQDVHSGSRKET